MLNFEYQNPVHIIFGRDTIARLNDLIDAEKKVMVVYGGGSIKRNGVYDQVVKALAGRSVVEFGGIEPNPQFATCMKAVKQAQESGVDFLLAVGGGSVLDATKFIAAAMVYEGADPWDILRTHGQEVTSAIPMGTVLTLPATGSEMNANSVISRAETEEKLHFTSSAVYPEFSIMDPQTIASLPENQIRNGIVDAFVHVVEQSITYEVNTPLQDRQAMAVLATLVQVAPDLMAGSKDYDLLANFMWAATHALNGVISCGVVEDWSIHMIGHELTAFYGVAHAESLAIVLPGVWERCFEKKKEKLANLAEALWGVTSGSVDDKAQAAIEKTEAFFHAIKMPTRLGDYGVKAADLDKLKARFNERGLTYGEQGDLGPEACGEIVAGRL